MVKKLIYPKIEFDEETQEDKYYDKMFKEYLQNIAYEKEIKYHIEHIGE